MSKTNSITVTGVLAEDPTMQTTGNGQSVCNVSISVTTDRYNRQTNAWEANPDGVFNAVAWGKLAEHVSQSLRKGDRVTAIGRLTANSYTNQQGQPASSMEIVLDEIAVSLQSTTTTALR